ncbi:1-acyl-sn-glycerol-3-phosphate acyltransferase [Ramlibacter henchirensis]|uniref:1-acyl-sn-glycerol-3-phosphate acyltransferase n=1 Tax=Ramlibacter henchirensis TaxID=204072 RepID=A0A4Z0BPR5_9BURK|nr:lysophospholipid acyltransferase family protein [Ramlibacter henchirensis]TFZ00390.1 1-acyl-sn-glycerol-3-phosphate acyltransferase [Ramlibacter henchirensis]
MRDRLERGWRVLATGLCFASFSLGSLMLGAMVFPFLRLAIRNRARRVAIARQVIRGMFRLFVGMMRATGVLTIEVCGAERLRGGGRLILANHPTLIDVVLLLALVDRGDCVIKGALGRNPIMRGTVRGAGFVFNDGGGEELLADCVQSVRTGNNLIIFPEGTRTSRDEPIRLQRGAARVAVHGELDITPVRIVCTPATLAKGEKWYRVPPRRVHFRIEVGEPIAVSPFIDASPTAALAARRLTRHLTDYFSREEVAIA